MFQIDYFLRKQSLLWRAQLKLSSFKLSDAIFRFISFTSLDVKSVEFEGFLSLHGGAVSDEQ